MAGPGSRASYGQNGTGSIETLGVGMVNPSISNETQRLATARDAALTQAQAKMLSILRNRPSDSVEDQEKLKAGILRDAYVVKTQWADDGTCQVTLRLKKPL